MNNIEITKIEIPIQGMTCANCAARIDKTLKNLPGIISSNVNLATDSAILEFRKNEIKFDEIKNHIETLGYKVFSNEEKDPITENFEQEQEKEYNKLKFQFRLSLFLSIPVIILNMEIAPLHNYYWFFVLKSIILFCLTTIILFYPGKQFFIGFIRSIKIRYADMNTLISIGTGTAYLYSTYLLIYSFFSNPISHTVHLYYDTTAAIITFILLGRVLEKGARGKTSSAIKNLLKLQPKKVKVTRDGFKMTIPVEYVKVGDTINLEPGEKVPVDGVIISGNSFVDESLITGESIPIEKKPGDPIIAGTLNKFGSLSFKAEKIGKDTYLSQIIKLVKEAQGSKAPIQKYADKIASIFVPSIIIIALITLIFWSLYPGVSIAFSIMNFVSVLIIACPCALGLATPTAIITGIGKAAEKNIYFKNSEILESARKLDTIIFDKTGTLTRGEIEVTEIISFCDYSSREILSLAASCEQNSEHPIGKAIVRKAEQSNLKLKEIENFLAVSGYGVSAKIYNDEYLIGNFDFLSLNNISLENDKNIQSKKIPKGPETKVYLSKNRNVIGVIFLSDILKDNVKNVIEKLKKNNLRVGLLSGDTKESAELIGKQIFTDLIYSEVKPEQKLEIIKSLQKEGKTIAMVGDGVNDAPALIQADIGIALSSGSDVAISSSDITLSNNDINSVYEAIIISKKTFKVIKQNLFWAFFYNTICIPIAGGILYPFFGILLNPGLAALAMAFSSISVVTNSLRLKRINLR